ncbi:MAG: DMT family transporter [Deltaproteobacteria bacterium]|nr:DMT family transporter [Deltaproteobacteria bacterium]
MMGQDLAGKLLSTLSALLWTGAIISFKRAEHTPPVQLNLVKNVVAVGLFGLTLPIAGVSWIGPADLRTWGITIASGVIGLGLGDVLFFAALNRLGAGLSAIVESLYSPFVFVLSVAFLGEPATASLIFGTVLVVTGLIVVADPSKSKTITRAQMVAGMILGTLSMLSMAVGVVMIKPVLAGHNVLWVIFWRAVAGGVMMAVWLVARGTHPQKWSIRRDQWVPVLSGTVLGTYLATCAWLYGMKYTTATAAAILNQLSTFFTLILAAVWLSEPITKRKALAAAVAFCGGAIILAGSPTP